MFCSEKLLWKQDTYNIIKYYIPFWERDRDAIAEAQAVGLATGTSHSTKRCIHSEASATSQWGQLGFQPMEQSEA